MDQVIDVLNVAGQAFCVHAGKTFVQSSILIGVLLVLDLAWRRRVRAVVRYAVWMLVFVKLLLPPALALPTGIGYYRPHETVVRRNVADPVVAAPVAAVRPPSVSVATRTADMVDVPGAAARPVVTTAPAKAPVRVRSVVAWRTWVFLAWCMGVLVLGVCLIRRFRYVRRLVRESAPAPGPFQDILARCARKLGLHRCPELRLSGEAPGPVVCGLLSPVVLMPTTLGGSVSEQRLRTVLVHELAHLKRADLWVNFVQTLLLVAYFYHPLLWLVNAIVRRLREQAVDETVLVALDAEAKGYSTTLIDLAEMTFARPIVGLRLIGIAESRKALEGRIRHMMTRPKPRTARVGWWGLLAVMAIGAALLPMARAQSQQADEELRTGPGLEVSATPVEFKVLLPEGVTVELVGLCQDPTTQGQPWWRPDGTTMDEPEIERRPNRSWQYPVLGYLLRFSGSDTISYTATAYVGDLIVGPGGPIGPDGQAVVYRGENERHTRSLRGHVDIEVDVAGGQWATYDDGLASMMGGDLDRSRLLLYPPVFILPGGAHIILSGLRPNPKTRGPKTLIEATSTAVDMNIQLECTAADGSVHTSLSRHMGAFKPLTQYTFGFPVPMQEIKRIALKYRPYYRVTFKNVSLRPGEKTEVQIQTTSASGAKDEPGMPDGENAETRAVSGTRLMDLDKALRIYADDHDDRFPDSMADAVDCYPINLPWLQQQVVYLGEGKTLSARPDAVLAYDKTMLEKGTGTLVLFADSHVDFKSTSELQALGIRSAPTSEVDLEMRVVSRTRLLDLGKALLIYANDHDDRFPEQLSDLREEVRVGLSWLLENVTYLGKDVSPRRDHPARVLAYDKTLLDKGAGTNVLYLDSHVVFESPKELERLGIRPVPKSAEMLREEAADRARVAVLRNLKRLALAAVMYADEHEDTFGDDLDGLEPYLGDPSLLTWVKENVEYVAGGAKLAGGTDAFKKPLAYWRTAPVTMQGTAVVFRDGHAEIVRGPRLQELGIEIQR